MVRRAFLLFLPFLLFIGGCVHKTDQSLPLPNPPEVSYPIDKVVVFPFGYDKTVPVDVRDKVYRSFIKYLIKRRKLYIIHPEIVKNALGDIDYLIDKKKAEELSQQLGADGFVIGYLSDFSREPLALSIDAQLYPLVNPDVDLCSGHQSYHSANTYTIARIKRYSSLFDWNKRPLGWERARIKVDIFLDFVAWDIVQSFF